jgi:hypothetical protein
MSTIRTFKTRNFRVAVEWDYETDYDHSWADAETLEQLRTGELTSYQMRAVVYDRDGNELGVDYLGDCIHYRAEDFMDHRACGKRNRELAAEGEAGRCGSYFADMISEAIREARQNWNKPRVRLRNA